jgi:hypothetical protein
MANMNVVVLALLLGCGGKKEEGAAGAGGGGGGGKVASCSIPSMQTCKEYRGDNLALGTESLAKLCKGITNDAVFADVACPPEKVIASCQLQTGKDFYYEGYPGTKEGIDKACATMKGM